MYHDALRIVPPYRERLARLGLDSVEAILTREDGRVAAWSRTTDTMLVPGSNGEPGFYVKRYYYPRWKNRVRAMFRGTFFGRDRGHEEFRSLNIMRRLGIPAVRPVAYGSRRCARFLAACFLITEEVPAACNLTTFASAVHDGECSVTAPQRATLLDRLARQIAEMHATGFAHGQLFWRNILVRTGPDHLPEYFLLDAQPRRGWKHLSARGLGWQRDLANTLVSALPFTTRTERLRFLKKYLNAPQLRPEFKTHAEQIDALATRWKRHERQRILMNQLFDRWNRQLNRELESQTDLVDAVDSSPGASGSTS